MREKVTLKETILEAALTILIAALLLSSFTTKAYATEPVAYLCISPSVGIATEIGEIFELSVDIANVENLRSVEFTVAYNTSLLDVVQAAQAPFFPSGSLFELENDDSAGLTKVDISLADSEPPLSGTGSLVAISFRAVRSSDACSGSPVNFRQTLLLDADSIPISHDSVGAVYFWQSLEPDPPMGGRSLDLYTKKGGLGPDQPGGTFVLGEEVLMTSYVTYNGYPVQEKLVGFQVFNPVNETALVRTSITDEDGSASISFRIPSTDSSIGTWRAIAVVDIAEETVWDTISFEVISELPVGGYTVSVRNPEQPISMPPSSVALVILISVMTFAVCNNMGRFLLRLSNHHRRSNVGFNCSSINS